MFLGLSGYPDGSNLASSCGLYGFANEVAFFSSKAKSELMFVFAVLFGSNRQAYEFVSYMFTSQPISWNNVIEYLAIVKGIYFKNIKTGFSAFETKLGSKSTLYFLFSADKKYAQMVGKLKSCKDYAAIIHPSSKNMHTYSFEWFSQYVLNAFNGPIGQSNLTYQQFQI